MVRYNKHSSSSLLKSRHIVLTIIYLLLISRGVSLLLYYATGTSFDAIIFDSEIVYDENKYLYKIESTIIDNNTNNFYKAEEPCNNPRNCQNILENYYNKDSVQKFTFRPVTYFTKDKFYITREGISMTYIDIIELILYVIIGIALPLII